MRPGKPNSAPASTPAPYRNDTVEMHPEDREAVREGRAYAKEMGPSFCADFREELDALITEYGDAAAEQALRNLRELFWTRMWTEKDTVR